MGQATSLAATVTGVSHSTRVTNSQATNLAATITGVSYSTRVTNSKATNLAATITGVSYSTRVTNSQATNLAATITGVSYSTRVTNSQATNLAATITGINWQGYCVLERSFVQNWYVVLSDSGWRFVYNMLISTLKIFEMRDNSRTPAAIDSILWTPAAIDSILWTPAAIDSMPWKRWHGSPFTGVCIWIMNPKCQSCHFYKWSLNDCSKYIAFIWKYNSVRVQH